jgi:hypothetical protein
VNSTSLVRAPGWLLALFGTSVLGCGGLLSEDRRPDPQLDASEPAACWERTTVSFLDPAVERAALNALERFEGAIAGPELLTIQTLDIEGAHDLADLTCFPNVRNLRLKGGSASDLAPAKHLPLAGLYVIDHPVDTLEPMRGVRLSTLLLQDVSVSDLGPVAETNALLELTLRRTRVSNVSLAENQPDLSSLDLRGSPVTSIQPIRNLKRLWTVLLDDTRISDLSPIGSPADFPSCPALSALRVPVNREETTSAVGELCNMGWRVRWSLPGTKTNRSAISRVAPISTSRDAALIAARTAPDNRMGMRCRPGPRVPEWPFWRPGVQDGRRTVRTRGAPRMQWHHFAERRRGRSLSV